MRFMRWMVGVLAVPAFGLLLGGLARGEDQGSPSFAEFVRESETVLCGTVDRAWVETSRRVHVPVVRVALRNVRVVKGPGMDRPNLAFWPSSASNGGRTSHPFRKGERYIFVTSESLNENRVGFAPIMPLNEGIFPVLYDRSLRRSFVHDSEGRPVTRIEKGRLFVVDVKPSAARTAPRPPSSGALSTGPWIEVLPTSEDSGTRLTEEDFLRAVREILTGQAP